jgi:acyl-coenzyme A synthetase/AMP-(fatty) acid ligase
MVVLLRPGIEFVAVVFALFKIGAIVVLVDPGMGRRRLLTCIADVDPDGFVTMPLVSAMRLLLRRRFSQARFNATCGRRPFWNGITLEQVRALGSEAPLLHDSSANDAAAIIFTSGSTGPPKGVLYCHGNFDRQIALLDKYFGFRSGDIDLAGFPLFALFNCTLGVTTVIPEMPPSRPAKVDPRRIIESIHDWHVTRSFGSPALWSRVGEYCQERKISLPSLRQVLSAGAPVPPRVLKQMKACIAADGEIHTPYGATEALPVASIAADEVLSDTQHRWALGGGMCVGRKVPGIDWKVIEITDRPIHSIQEAVELPEGQIGELIVCGRVVTREYVTPRESNATAKIAEASRTWHRMGDVGYLDNAGRFWFCGRKDHRVQTANSTMFTIPCEAIFNQHPAVARAALVGVGEQGQQRPVMVIELSPTKRPRTAEARRTLRSELREIGRAHPLTECIHDFLIHPSLPVDARHNSKILRDELGIWAGRELRRRNRRCER